MITKYSANDELKKLAQNLGFKLYLFDDPFILGNEIKLRDKSKGGEIDAIMLYKNILFLVGINKGKGNINNQITKFYEKLDKVEKVDDLKTKLVVEKKIGKDISEKEEVAKKMVKEIEDYLEKKEENYDILMKKIFFAPNKDLDEEKLLKRKSKGEIVIDKDINQYFMEVLDRINKDILLHDFLYFLEVKKSNFRKKDASGTGKPGKSDPRSVTKIVLNKDKIIMYSLSARVEDLIEYTTVLRMSQKYDKKGFQRMIKSTRLDKINKKYLSKNETFPNNIIIFLNPLIYKNEKDFYDEEKKEISLLNEYNSLIIIDGQHRFFSFVRGEKLDRQILITLIFLNGKDKKENFLQMERIFYSINKTQERVDANLSFVLKARIDEGSEENFWYEVFQKLNKKGFFSGKFSFKESTLKNKVDGKKSAVSVITYGGVLRLNKLYNKKGLVIDGLDTFYSEDRKKNIIFAFNLLKNYFDIIEKVLYNQKFDKTKLGIREIGALLRIIKHFMLDNKRNLKILGEIEDITKSDENDILNYYEDILNGINFESLFDLNLSTSNWAAVEGVILKQINNLHPSFGNKQLLSKKGLEMYEGF